MDEDDRVYQDMKQAARWKAQRRANRVEREVGKQLQMDDWCEDRGIDMTVKNDGQHWRFVMGRRSADWWPSSAKLVLNQKFDAPIHATSAEQVQRILTDRWCLT